MNRFDKENKCNSMTENKKRIQDENQTDTGTRNDKLLLHIGKYKEIILS